MSAYPPAQRLTQWWRAASNLRGAEATEAAYVRFLGYLELLQRSTSTAADPVFAEVLGREISRLQELVAEYGDDVDACRDAVIASGMTPERYEQWLEQNPIT